MSQDVNMERANEVYNNIVNHLNSIGWSFDRHDEDLVITTGIKSEDLPINFLIVVNAKNEVVQFISKLPFNVAENKRVEAAIAVCVANYGLVDGSFDYDIGDGEIRYRLTCSYRGNSIGGDVIEYIIAAASQTVEEYNDRFLMISEGVITLEKFVEMDNG